MVVLQVDFHVLLEWTETNGCLEGGKCSNATSFIVNGLKNLLNGQHGPFVWEQLISHLTPLNLEACGENIW